MVPVRQGTARILALVAILVLAAHPVLPVGGGPSAEAAAPPVSPSLLAFVENRGQIANDDVRYVASAGRLRAGFAPGAVLYALSADAAAVLVGTSFLGAGPVPPEGRDALPQRSHYFLGNDPARWRTDVPSYGEVVYEDVWAGIDAAYRATGAGVKYEFRVAPGARPERIVLAYEGIEGLSLSREGDLVVRTAAGDLRDTAPTAHQDGVAVPCRFDLRGPLEAGFRCDGWDPTRPLVIDPLVYATYLGGGLLDFARAVAVDGAGNAYVTGEANSTDFPTTPGAFDRTHTGGFYDAFVAKFSAAGDALLWATFLGGIGANDLGTGIALDASGNVYVAGQTDSPDFPVTNGSYDTSLGAEDAFLVKLRPNGDALAFGTFLGGDSGDAASSLVLDGAGNAYLTGVTTSPDFPTTPGAYRTVYGGGIADAFVTGVTADGTGLRFSTFLGASMVDSGFGIARDTVGFLYVAGSTNSADFPTTPGAFDRSLSGPGDGFVAKLDPNGASLAYATFLGGSAGDGATSIAVDASGNAYVAGMTESPDFPTSAGALDTTYAGRTDLFAAKIDPTGGALVYGTYIGGTGEDSAPTIRVDAAGHAYLTGQTSSTDFPTTAGAPYPTYRGGQYDAFALRLNATAGRVVYGTYLGGGRTDSGYGLALDAPSVVVVGATNSTDFPATAGSYDTTPNGQFDAFLAKVTLAFPVTVGTNPSGLTVEVDGIPYLSPRTFLCEPGATYVVNAPSPQVLAGTRYAFSSWSDGGAPSHAITCASPSLVVATYLATEHQVVVATAPPGLQIRVDGSPFPAPYAFWCIPTSSHTLDTPTPQGAAPTRYVFRDWSDGGARFHTIPCDTAKTVTASFTTEHEVVVATAPPGLQVLADGVPWTAPQAFWWADGSVHGLDAPSPQAQGPSRYVFVQWSDGGAKDHSVAISGPATFTATFAAQVQITVATAPPGLQVVVDGATGTSPLSAWCDQGAVVAVDTPTPQGGPPTRYAFASWSDGGAKAHGVVCDASRTVTAFFAAEHEIVLRTSPSGLQVEVEGVPATAPHAFWCAEGDRRTIGTPTPQGGPPTRYAFASWSDGGMRSHPITCTGPATITASFSREHEVVVATSPPGMLVTVDGVTAAAPLPFWWAEGSFHAVDVPSPQGGAPTRHAFASWSDGGARAHAVGVTGPATLTATLIAEHLVTFETDPPGLDVRVDGVGRETPYAVWWVEGSSHGIDVPTAQSGAPGVRYRWLSWGDGGPQERTVTATGPTTYTASFATEYRLTVSSAHGQARCDVDTCWYGAGAVAAVSVSSPVPGPPGTRYVFRGWAGDASGTAFVVAVTMDRPKAVQVLWATEHFLRVVTPYGTPSGEDWYEDGFTATFSVDRTDVRGETRRYRFVGWTGDASGAAASGTVLMDGPKTVVATWEAVSGTDVAAGAFLGFLLLFAVLLFLAAWYLRRRDREEDEPPPEP